MSLNIKSEEARQLAKELAQLTGETMTGAVTVALRERLEREKRRRSVEARVREMRAIGQRLALHLPKTVFGQLMKNFINITCGSSRVSSQKFA